jgi:glutamine cyclotransferase
MSCVLWHEVQLSDNTSILINYCRGFFRGKKAGKHWSNVWYTTMVQRVTHYNGPTCGTLQWSNVWYTTMVLRVVHNNGPTCGTLQWSNAWYTTMVQRVAHYNGPTCGKIQ